MDQKERITNILKVLEGSVDRIRNQAEIYHSRAKSERRYHTLFGVTLAVLGVAAPTLVSFQTRLQSPTLQLLAIVVTAIVGAAGALQATFRWGDRFRRTSVTALALEEELESATRLEFYDIRDTQDDLKIYARAYALNGEAQKKLQQITRQHIEAEFALIAPEGDKRKPQAEQ